MKKEVKFYGILQPKQKSLKCAGGDTYLTIEEASNYLTNVEKCATAPQTIRNLMSKGLFPYKKIGGRVVISLNAVQRWLKELNRIFEETRGAKPKADDVRREAMRRITANLNKGRINYLPKITRNK